MQLFLLPWFPQIAVSPWDEKRSAFHYLCGSDSVWSVSSKAIAYLNHPTVFNVSKYFVLYVLFRIFPTSIFSYILGTLSPFLWNHASLKDLCIILFMITHVNNDCSIWRRGLLEFISTPFTLHQSDTSQCCSSPQDGHFLWTHRTLRLVFCDIISITQLSRQFLECTSHANIT